LKALARIGRAGLVDDRQHAPDVPILLGRQTARDLGKAVRTTAGDELEEKPALIVNHPRSSLFQGYFGEAQLDPVTAEPGRPELWSDNFDAIEVFNSDDFDGARRAFLNARKHEETRTYADDWIDHITKEAAARAQS